MSRGSRTQENREHDRVIRSWIMQTPRPSTLRVTSEDGERQAIVCGSSTWAQVAVTVLALNPDKLEALDSQGQILRATSVLDLYEADAGGVEDRAATTPAAPLPPQSRVPSLTELVGDDPESKRFALVAHLLADAYRHSTDVAFDKLAAFAQHQADRAGALERTVDAWAEAERLRVEVQRQEVEARERASREEEDEEEQGEVGKAIDKIAKHVAQAVGADEDGDDGDDDEDEPQQPSAAPNGAGGH